MNQLSLIEGGAETPPTISTPPENPFDYDELESAVASVARLAANQVRMHQFKAAALSGQEIAKAKEVLGHGHFLRWLRDELNMTPRTAQNLMSVAERFGENTKPVSHLPTTVLYTLAAPSTPECVRTEMLERFDKGEALSNAELKQIVREKKAVIAERARLAKMTEAQRIAEEKRRRALRLKEIRSEAHQRREREESDRADKARKQRQAAAYEELNKALRAHFTDEEIGRLYYLFDQVGWLEREEMMKAAGLKPHRNY